MSCPETFAARTEELVTLLPPREFTGPIVWWNHGLSFGGVERQILATSVSLARNRLNLELLTEDLTPGKTDAFLARVQPYFSKISCIFNLADAFRPFAPQAVQAVDHYFAGLHPVRRQLIAMYAAWFAIAKPRLVQVWNADYIHVALAGVLAGVPNILMRCASLSPGFRYPLGVESVNDVLAKDVFRYLLQFPALFLTGISASGRRDYAAWLGIEEGGIYATQNAFVPEQWDQKIENQTEKEQDSLKRKLDIPESAPVLGGMFRFTYMKHPELWLETALTVLAARSDVYAVLAGDGELFEKVRHLAANSQFAERIKMPGMLLDAAAFYRSCNVFLHTSRCEGLGNVTLEAQYSRLPVVCTECGGTADVIEDKKTGFLVAERDPKILAAHVLYALDNPEWSARAGQAGREKILRDFSARRSAMAYLKIYADRGCL